MQSKSFKIITFIIIALMVFLALGGLRARMNQRTLKSKSEDSRLTVITSFYPMYVHTINVAKDVKGVNVINLTKPQTGCLHDYQLTPDDLKTLEDAKVFVINGAGMEAFLDKVIRQIPDLKIINASQGIQLIKGYGQEGDNPHVWVSISAAMQQVKNIGDQLAAIDPANGDKYRKNAADYIKKLAALKEEMHKALDGVQNRNIITFHEAFPYFAREFNLKILDVIEREPGSEPSARQLAETIDTINKSKVKALFAEPQYPAKAADIIAAETGLKVAALDPVVTGEADGDLDAYLKVMEQNLKSLQEALQ